VNALKHLYSGRLNRQTYFGGFVLCILVFIAEAFLEGLILRILGITDDKAIIDKLYFVQWVSIILIQSSLYVRRLHDIGSSGKWFLLLYIPLVALIIGLLPGEQKKNKYGPQPTPEFNLLSLFLGGNGHDLK
jgi:uncharacterized membrane protein YhaH (DUF805 family)